MTVKTLTGTYASGYEVKPPVQTVSVTTTGYVEGSGLHSSGSRSYTIVNLGKVSGTASAVGLYGGSGSITNGTSGNTTASIAGYDAGVEIEGVGTIVNYGRITDTLEGGAVGPAVYLVSGGLVTNGTSTDNTALIEGAYGVFCRNGSGAVTNFGTITATGFARSPAVILYEGGSVVNGSLGDTVALLRGDTGVFVKGGVGDVTNFGEIVATSADPGVGLLDGGTVTNGTSFDITALIEGDAGVSVSAASGAVTNFGTILGDSPRYDGVVLAHGGGVTNGSAADTVALIEGYYGGVSVSVTAGAVTNFGTIRSTGGSHNFGVNLEAGGTLVNGAVNDPDAAIIGYGGVHLDGPGTSVNFGVIRGVGGSDGGYGVMVSGASLVNGAATDAGALITGYLGVELVGASTLTSFGTIRGAGGVAVELYSATAALAVEAGSVFEGAVLGDGGTLDLASGTGTMTLLAGDSIKVSGSMSPTTFSGFHTVEVGTGATFTTSGAVSIAAGQSVIDAGALTINAGATTIANAGTIEATSKGTTVIDSAVKNTGAMIAFGGNLTVEDAVTGAGTVRVGTGTADFVSTFAENVTFGSTGELELSHSQTYTGQITGFSKTGATSLDLVDIAFGSKTTAKFSGSATTGVLTVTDGTHTAKITLEGDYLGSTFKVSSDGHGGTTVIDPVKPAAPHLVPAAVHPFIAAAASFGAATSGWRHPNPETWRSSHSLLATPRP